MVALFENGSRLGVEEMTDQSNEGGIKLCSTLFQVIFSIRSGLSWGELFVILILLCRGYIIEPYGNFLKNLIDFILSHTCMQTLARH